ncbi:MAG: GNAT family N-acetyltransferase [Tabrizicola sp.]
MGEREYSMQLLIRKARSEEAAALHALAVRSKAVWGYDASFMALAAPKLALEADWFAAGRVLAAEADGTAAGVAVVLPPDAEGVAELDHLFVAPTFLRRGIGAALLEAAVVMVRSDGARALRALADPQARPFYERQGFRWLGDAPSDAIPGRMLPLMLRDLGGGG